MRSPRPDPPSREPNEACSPALQAPPRLAGGTTSDRGGTMGLNLASIVTDSAARAAEAVAVRLGPLELTYGELDDRSARLAALLRERGLGQGDRIGVMLPNVLEFPISY